MKKQILVGLVIVGSLQAMEWGSPVSSVNWTQGVQQSAAVVEGAVQSVAAIAATAQPMQNAKEDMKALRDSMARAVADLKAAQTGEEIENIKERLRGMQMQIRAYKTSPHKDNAVNASRPDLTIGGMAGSWIARIDGIISEASKKKRNMNHILVLDDIMSRMSEDMSVIQQ